jgi:hypothetical protein
MATKRSCQTFLQSVPILSHMYSLIRDGLTGVGCIDAAYKSIAALVQ